MHPKSIAVAPVKAVPVIVTEVPAAANPLARLTRLLPGGRPAAQHRDLMAEDQDLGVLAAPLRVKSISQPSTRTMNK